MKIGALAWITAALLAPIPGMGAGPVHPDELAEPRLDAPRPPHGPLLFTRTSGRGKQSLELRYMDSRTISFRLEKSGTCNRHEQATATVKPYWWLAAETDENEAGEMIAVQEYVFRKANQCTIYVRIDESEWKQATVKESPQCTKECPLSEEAMGLKK